MRLQRTRNIGLILSDSRRVVALRIELSAPWLSAEDGQPALDYRVVLSSSYGNRTHPSALKGQRPLTDRRTSRVFKRRQRAQWAGRRSNPRLRLFRPLLDRLSHRPKRKKPDVAVTPGFEKLRSVLGRGSTAQRMRGQRIRRLTGDATFASFAYQTRPQNQHWRYPRSNLTQLLP